MPSTDNGTPGVAAAGQLKPSSLPRLTQPESGPAGAVAAFYDALIAQDAQRAIALLSTDAAWYEAPGSPYGREDGGPYRGGSEVALHVLAPQAADVDGLQLAQHEMLVYGGTIIVLGTAHGRGARTGAALRARVGARRDDDPRIPAVHRYGCLPGRGRQARLAVTRRRDGL